MMSEGKVTSYIFYTGMAPGNETSSIRHFCVAYILQCISAYPDEVGIDVVRIEDTKLEEQGHARLRV